MDITNYLQRVSFEAKSAYMVSSTNEMVLRTV